MVGALLLVFLHHAPDLRPGRDDSLSAAEPLAAAIEERLEADAELVQRVAARIPADLTARDAASAFDVLANAYETLPLRGRGLRLGAREAGTVAWYGKMLGEPEGELLASFRVGPVPARLVRREGAVGAVLRTTAGGWTVELEDLWLRRSPVEALGVPPGGWLAEEAAERGVGVELGRPPDGGGDVVAGPGAPLVVAGAPVGRLLGEPLGADAGASPAVFRLAALLLLASFAFLVAGRWRELERESAAAPPTGAPGGSEPGGAAARLSKLPPLVEKAMMVVGVRLLLEAGDLLDVLVPGPLSSPLSFAVGLLGPFTRSPIDFFATALLAALLAGEVLREAVRRPARPGAARAGDLAVLGLLAALLAAAALVRGGLVDAAAPLVRDTSAELLFDPTLYSRPEGAVLFAALAASAAVVLLLLASAFAAIAGAGSGRRPLTERALGWSAPGAVILCAAAGLALAREAAGVSGGLLAFLLACSAILGGLALAGLAAMVVRGGPAQIRAQAAAAALLAVLAASGVATAHGAGRIWALRLFLADRLEEVGSPSNQWIEYNLGLTSERLTGAADLSARVARDPEGAAFEAWTRTPLGELPFLSALLLVDARGSVLSRFSLLPPQDLELLPGIARAALRAPPGALGRLVSETGRSLLYTGVPVSGGPGAPWAVAVVVEIAEPGLAEESAQYFLQNVFFSGPADPILLAVRRGDPAPPSGRALTLASGAGEERFWISVALGPYLPDLLDHLSLALTAALVTAALFALHRTVLQALPAPTRASVRPLATFRGRVFAVLLALVALPLAVYTLLSFQATRHEIDQATRALAEESLRSASAFLGPRLQAGGGAAELEAILPEAARLVGQDLLVYRGGTLAASSRPEIFQTGLLDRRMPGELYRRLAFAGDRLVTERAEVGAREVLVAHLRTPWDDAGRPYVLASPLLLRAVHVESDRRELVQALYVMFVLSLLALGVFSWIVSRQLASPLAALREGADRIARGELAHRLRGPERHDEFGRLFSAFNTMAAGLQVSQGELVAEKGRMQAIVSSIGAGVLALDREGRIQLANRAARELLDLPPDVAGLRPGDVLPPAFWERASRALRLGHRREDEVRLADGGGSRILHLTFAPLVGEGGERRGLVVVFEDLSAVLASQRAVAWEEMARQVAHEIKNPLTPIKLSLQHVGRLLERPPDDLPSRLRRTLDLVLSEIGRLERIAGEFSRFGARGRDARPMDPEPVLREVAALYAPAGGPGVELAVEGAPALVRADEDGLKKILVNLLENAREAMGADDGSWLGRAPAGDDGAGAGETGSPDRSGAPEEAVIRLALRYEAGPGHAEILVRDTGPGIAREDLERLFEPYFSTKTRGTGLGLAIARRIVESWGGTIEARNWDRGAEVVLRLEKSASGSA